MESPPNESLEQRVQRLEAHIRGLQSYQRIINAQLNMHEFVLEVALANMLTQVLPAISAEYIRQSLDALDNPVLPKSVSPGQEQAEAAVSCTLPCLARLFFDKVAAREKALRALNGL